ncbi:MAG: hypothetical protein AAGJ37_04550, partial [Pseudomonadota bacterium]
DAMLEIEVLNTTKRKMGLKPLTVKEKASTLGISMGAFDNYNVLCRYPAVVESYENGNRASFIKVKKRVLELEKTLFESTGKLNVTQKKTVNKALKDELIHGIKNPLTLNTNRKEGKRAETYDFGAIKTTSVLKKLLQDDVTQINTGINWDALDWENIEDVNKQIKLLIKRLEGS